MPTAPVRAHTPRRRSAYEPLVFGVSLPEIKVMDSDDVFRIIVPSGGIDLRQFYVLVTSCSILIEIRIKRVVTHLASGIREVQEQRVNRELRLTSSIKEGATVVRALGDDLEITCLKMSNGEERTWSELLRLDTRASVGCI